MKTYLVEIKESGALVVAVEAESEMDAREMVDEAIASGELADLEVRQDDRMSEIVEVAEELGA